MENGSAASVYKAFDQQGRLLYVGISKNWARRWAQHSATAKFFPDVARIEVEWVATIQVAASRERELIKTLRPARNVVHLDQMARSVRAARPPEVLSVREIQCEACDAEAATSLSWFADRERWYAPRSGIWKLTGDCTSDSEQYYVWLRDPRARHGFFDSVGSRKDWLDHLRGKTWFDEMDFFAAVTRATSV